ncbi:rod shape-determining protein MreD [Oxobacter pfennigii]|uniref:Rod shape-determining protein MreD n=1 Tax=Oxobacter pfennigii TaxID=36849 RepID=A0A0P8Y722_9CLOT|nr:rod shape-determining protein MreD [Oxobacter pfennigii]KPU42246.1 rod shape-determining protein MreD [Oxobacter pfennigii]
MKKFAIPLLLLILTALQNSLFEYIKVFGVKPNIVLVFVICITLIKGNPLGTIVGIGGGILEDIFFQGAFGINSISCMLAAFIIGSVEGKIYKDNVIVPGFFVFAGTVIKEMIVYLFLYLIRTELDIMTALTSKIIPEAIYNTILAFLFYRYIVKFVNKIFAEQAWKY